MENNPKSENQVFFSFCTLPQIKFETYEPGEKILLLLRSHPFTQIGLAVNIIILIFVLILINFIVSSFLAMNQIFLLNCFAIAFILSYVWFSFLNWYFNVGIVTNRRVIDIDFTEILYKEITVAMLDKIEDITVKSGGYFESYFDFGTIYIQTAATKDVNVVFDAIPHPSQTVDIIEKLLTKRKHGV